MLAIQIVPLESERRKFHVLKKGGSFPSPCLEEKDQKLVYTYAARGLLSSLEEITEDNSWFFKTESRHSFIFAILSISIQ